jgi:hypothetical protein
MSPKTQPESTARPATVTIPELEQSKTAVLNALASRHSRRSYQYAIDRFIAWYCNEPRLTFNRSVVVSYRSSLERLSLSAATINLQLSAIRRLADESAESGWLSPELAIGIPRVKGVKRLGRKMGNWLTRNQAQCRVRQGNCRRGCKRLAGRKSTLLAPWENRRSIRTPLGDRDAGVLRGVGERFLFVKAAAGLEFRVVDAIDTVHGVNIDHVALMPR